MNASTMRSAEYQSQLKKAWSHFINDRDFDYSCVRPEILESWKRSKQSGVNPVEINYSNLSSSQLNLKINKNIDIIDIVHPYLERLYEMVKGSGSYILLCDREGYIIDFKGDADIIAKGGTTKLGPGAMRDEKSVGTNAIGTALFLKQPIQIWGEEHYAEKHKGYTCSGAPFFDADGSLCGCINITVTLENAHPHTLGMALCAADSITKELKLRQAMVDVNTVNTQLNSIIENMTSGVILLNKLGRVIQINKYAIRLLHLSYESIIGQDLFDYIMIDNYDRYDAHHILKKEKYNEEVSLVLRMAPGSPRRFNLSVIHVKDDMGTQTGTILRFNKPELLNKLVKNIGGFSAKYTFDSIIGRSEVMQNVINYSKKAAAGDANVLILGESGTGKELIAQSIHNASPVANGPFVAINCGAIPNSLVESELFGYEKGAFTGAEKEGRPGKFEMADGGTIFLDEIGDMPFNVQATLLRVIQTKEIVRIGGKFPKPVSIRIIAATNQNLLESVNQKTFREDLYYRLNVFTISVPPLNARGKEDISLLISYFISQYNRKKHTEVTIDEAALERLKNYHWPGNVRQLENAIERAVNLCSDDKITCDDLPPLITSSSNTAFAEFTPHSDPGFYDSEDMVSSGAAPSRAEASKPDMIKSALEETGGNVTAAAKKINMNLRTLYRKIEKYNIDVSQYRN